MDLASTYPTYNWAQLTSYNPLTHSPGAGRPETPPWEARPQKVTFLHAKSDIFLHVGSVERKPKDDNLCCRTSPQIHRLWLYIEGVMEIRVKFRLGICFNWSRCLWVCYKATPMNRKVGRAGIIEKILSNCSPWNPFLSFWSYCNNMKISINGR